VIKDLNIAKLLLNTGCFQVNLQQLFLYASGIKGPIYCDNRKILSFPKERDIIIDSFINMISENKFDFDHIAGVATSGIPFGAMIADRMGKSFIYIRAESKAHGKKKQIEGDYNYNDKILLIEDLVNQASSLEKICFAARDNKLNIVAALSIIDYQMPVAKTKLDKLGVELFSLSNFSNLSKAAVEEGIISEDDFNALIDWKSKL
jgi:orotate phosphoribosyltransferase